MRWRLLELNWPYAIGELVIVVVGVLVALAVDQWNGQRLDRIQERELVDLLISDLQADLESLSVGREVISMKRASLEKLYSGLEARSDWPDDIQTFLQDIVSGAAYGWSQARALRPTYSELLASGKLVLIRDAAIRAKIVGYYDSDLIRQTRIEERETGYPALSYSLVPRSLEYEAAVGASDVQIQRVLDRLREPSSRDVIVAELNFAGFLREQFALWEQECAELIGELESYLQSIG